MTRLERTVERREYSYGHVRRTSWGAIFGGTFIALASMSVLGALGIAVSAMTIDPATGDTPSLSSIGIGLGIWWVFSGIVSVFFGAWTASRLSGLSRGSEGPLHGLITWAFSSVIVLFMLSSFIGSLMAGVMGLAKTGVAAVSQGAQTIAEVGVPGVDLADAIPEISPERAWRQVRSEGQKLLRDADTRALQPDRIEDRIGGVTEELRDIPQADDMQAAERELDDAVSALYRAAANTARAVDKEAVVNVLVARTDMSRTEAEKQVEMWSGLLESAWTEARGALRAAGSEVSQTTAEVVEASASAVSGAAWLSFFYLLLTGGAALVGGRLGAPGTGVRGRRAVRTESVDTTPGAPLAP